MTSSLAEHLHATLVVRDNTVRLVHWVHRAPHLASDDRVRDVFSRITELVTVIKNRSMRHPEDMQAWMREVKSVKVIS
jgi:hypothetical protein